MLAFVGQLLISEHDGRWLVTSDPDSPAFGRYVAGDMSRGADPSAVIDPAAIVEELFTQPPGRSRVALIDSAEAQSLARPGEAAHRVAGCVGTGGGTPARSPAV